MCGGVRFNDGEQEVTTYFPNPKACLPVQMKTGGSSLMPWGRRREQPGKLPQGGWARLESIQQGVWDKWAPVPVKIAVSSFMEKDQQGQSHWYPLEAGQWIQGLVATTGSGDAEEQRVYVVTVPPPMANAVHDRWPRVIPVPVSPGD